MNRSPRNYYLVVGPSIRPGLGRDRRSLKKKKKSACVCRQGSDRVQLDGPAMSADARNGKAPRAALRALAAALLLCAAQCWPMYLPCNRELKIGGREIHGHQPKLDATNHLVVRRDKDGGVLFSGDSYVPGDRLVVTLAGDDAIYESGKAQFRATGAPAPLEQRTLCCYGEDGARSGWVWRAGRGSFRARRRG